MSFCSICREQSRTPRHAKRKRWIVATTLKRIITGVASQKLLSCVPCDKLRVWQKKRTKQIPEIPPRELESMSRQSASNWHTNKSRLNTRNSMTLNLLYRWKVLDFFFRVYTHFLSLMLICALSVRPAGVWLLACPKRAQFDFTYSVDKTKITFFRLEILTSTHSTDIFFLSSPFTEKRVFAFCSPRARLSRPKRWSPPSSGRLNARLDCNTLRA